MSMGKKIWILLAVAILIAIVSVACSPAEPTSEPIPPTPTPPTGISRAEAIEAVIKEVAEPSEAPYGLRVHMYPELLPKGSTIVPFAPWMKGEKEFIVCDGECWFFWFDDNPLAQFAHETRYVLVDTSTGEVAVREAEWWPVVNGKVIWGKTEERASDEFLIFEKPSELDLSTDWRHDFDFGVLQAAPGCEAWAILVCGSDDIGNTFDEDVQYLYNVLTGLGYDDAHIFYVSPWTTDPGVDQVTSVANVQWAINQVAANSDAEDKVFFFYSSHGGVDSLNCYPGSPGGGFVSSTDMDNWLDTITAREMIIMLQGCHTGSFIGAYSDGTVVAAENELTGGGETNRIAITATDTDHSSYGGASSWGSTFTGGYVAAFGDPAADVDSNGAISVDEAYTYAYNHDSAALAGWSFPQIDPTSLDPADVFHTCPLVDVWISDGPTDVGNNSYDYASTDIWSSLSPTGTSHEDPVSGLTNTVHVVVHNLGSSSVSNVDVTLYWADTSTALAWPADFTQIGTTYTIPSISAGGDVEHTWPWYVDPAFGLGHHFCFVATADSTADPLTGGPPGATYVAPYDNNIAQKNITIVEVPAGESARVWFFIENNMGEMIPFDLVIRRADFPEGQLLLSLPDDLTRGLLERTDLLDGLEFVDREGQEMPGLLVTAKEEAAVRQIELKPLERREVTLEVIASEGAEVGEDFTVRIEEVAKEEVIGAITFLIRIVPPGDCPSTLKRAAEVYAQIALKYESEAAAKLVEMIGESLLAEICQDREAVMEWKYAAFDLEARVGDELQGQVPEEALDAYFEAIEALKAALEAGDFEEMMIAQEAVVEAGTTFLTGRP
jgi:hypothetical protein